MKSKLLNEWMVYLKIYSFKIHFKFKIYNLKLI
jgi:hypothetical protein